MTTCCILEKKLSFKESQLNNENGLLLEPYK